jgi:hypothetical protein
MGLPYDHPQARKERLRHTAAEIREQLDAFDRVMDASDGKASWDILNKLAGLFLALSRATADCSR